MEEDEGSVNIWEILSMPESVTRDMEYEKQDWSAQTSRITYNPNYYKNIQDISQRHYTGGRICQDWRGIISQVPLNMQSRSMPKCITWKRDSMMDRRDILKSNQQAVESSVHTVTSVAEDFESQKCMIDLKNPMKNVRNAKTNVSSLPDRHTGLLLEKKNLTFSSGSYDPACEESRSEIENYIAFGTDRTDKLSSELCQKSKLNHVKHETSEKYQPDDSEIAHDPGLQSPTWEKKTIAHTLKKTHGLFAEEKYNEKIPSHVGNQDSCDAGFQNQDYEASVNVLHGDNACWNTTVKKTVSMNSIDIEPKNGNISRQKNTKESGFRRNRQQKTHCKEPHSIYNRKHSDMKEWISLLNENKHTQETIRKGKMQGEQKKLQRVNIKSAGKLKMIGPHVEVYEAFSTLKKEPSSRIIINAVICIQKCVRGWLVRTKLKSLKAKAASHGPSFLAVVEEYRKMMNAIQFRMGVKKPTTPLLYAQLEEWIDKKTMYENMFSKREFWKEMDKSELAGFFRDCSHFPSRQHIDDACGLFNQRLYGKHSEVFSKHQVVEMAFTLYPPQGARLNNQTIRKSTWIHPIVDGEEGNKYLVSGHLILKDADIRIAGELVASSIRERKAKIIPTQNTTCSDALKTNRDVVCL